MDGARPRFVADVMLGGLARWLRMMDCDVFYDRAGEDSRLLAIALSENRILLTRDRELADRAGESGYLIQSDGTAAELREVVAAFGIPPEIYGNRCPECNGRIVDVERESIKNEVPRYTYLTHQKFRRCEDCGRIYWSGSHRELASEDLERMLSEED